MIEFLEVGKYYKLETKGEFEKPFVYTARIIAKGEQAVRILTIRNEDVVLRDSEITKYTKTTGDW
jgi:hypothetical protein